MAKERKYRGEVPLHDNYGPEAKFAVAKGQEGADAGFVREGFGDGEEGFHGSLRYFVN